MENKITMLTIKEAAAMVEGLTEYRVRQMCVNKQIPCIMAGKKYLINKGLKTLEKLACGLDISVIM